MKENTETKTAFTYIAETLAEARKVYTETALSAVYLAAIDIFNQDERIKAIGWRQFIPYFNDGDPCTFHICDGMWLEFTDVDREVVYIYNPEYDVISDAGDGEVDEDTLMKSVDEIYVKIKPYSTAFFKFLWDNALIIQDAFGNNAHVWIKRDCKEATVERYTDHD